MLEDKYVKMEQYLRGEMTAEEVLAFEKLVENDIDLANELTLEKEFYAHYNQERIPINDQVNREALETYFKSDEAQQTKAIIQKVAKTHRKKSVKFPKMIAAVAVGIMICVFGYLQFDTNLYQQYYTENDMPILIERGAADQVPSTIVIAYRAQNFEKANELYRNYLKTNSRFNENVYIYGGMSYLALGNFDQAIIEFNKMTTSNSLDKSKGLWFQALAYVKMNDREKARAVLKQLVSDPNSFNYQKAKRLLEELN